MKEYLDSDRVNFLIWRYLIEGDYRETAAKLQREWRVESPHRHFDFAPHVKNHALVSVLDRGLLYLGLEREYAASQARGAPAVAEAPATGVFGPLIFQPPPKEEELEEPPSDSTTVEVENGRKRQVDRQSQAAPNGSPAKRPKLSNGYENGAIDAGLTAMDIDQQLPETNNENSNNHAYPSPLEGEQAATPIMRTDGPEQATQVEKVDELGSEAIFLGLGADDPTGTPQARSGTGNPIVLHCEWNPQDPSMLAAAGTDALARVWTLSRPLTSGADPMTSHVNGSNRSFEDLVENDLPRTVTVTSMAWTSDGQAIAVATDAGSKARLSLWAPDGTQLHRVDVAEPPLVELRWNPSNQCLLGIAPDHGGSLVTVFSAQDTKSASYVLRDHDLSESPLQACWISDSDFVLCGGDVLIALQHSSGEINLTRKFETQKDDAFGHVQYDFRSRLLATSNEKYMIDLWDENGQRRPISAHTDSITRLQWQPLPPDGVPDDERLLASSSEDGSIMIWNARAPEGRAKHSMTMDGSVVALAFTPDGAFLAGATADRILIWKVGEHVVPRASWSRAPHPAWSSPRTTGSADEEDTHCLCWDSTGQKLAYGANSRLAVINFR